jgi:hypothetical protein
MPRFGWRRGNPGNARHSPLVNLCLAKKGRQNTCDIRMARWGNLARHFHIKWMLSSV